MKILEVKNLSKIYGKEGNETIAIDNISFSVEKGEFITIVGASGSGKSTLLHMIAGVDFPSSGSVLVNNTNIYELDEKKQAAIRRREVALIYQFYNLIPVLTVEENICLPLKLDNKEINFEKLENIIQKLGLQEKRKKLPNTLSGGQQQRVAIGRSLMQEPQILLADEPTGNLDSKNSKEIIELLKTANREYHQTIILVTHSEQIAKQATRTLLISDGKLQKDERLNR